MLVGNGPGDPAVLDGRDRDDSASCSAACPLFGICLGHQLSALALGLETFKLPFGHRGANHPVRDLRSGRVLVTVQNHGFAVEDGGRRRSRTSRSTTARSKGSPATASRRVQFHPEAAPGPLDALPFFDRIAATCRSAPTFARS